MAVVIRRGRPPAREHIVPIAAIIPANQLVVPMTIRQLSLDALRDTEACIDWLARHGLLRNTRLCPHCPGQVACRFQNYAQLDDGHRWMCPQCNTTCSIRADSFFLSPT